MLLINKGRSLLAKLHLEFQLLVELKVPQCGIVVSQCGILTVVTLTLLADMYIF